MSKQVKDQVPSASRPVAPRDDFYARMMDRERVPAGAGAKRETVFQSQRPKKFNAYGCM